MNISDDTRYERVSSIRKYVDCYLRVTTVRRACSKNRNHRGYLSATRSSLSLGFLENVHRVRYFLLARRPMLVLRKDTTVLNPRSVKICTRTDATGNPYALPYTISIFGRLNL